MVQRKDNLFELIHSLSPAEKRYFKSFVNADVGQQGSKYLQLFNTLSRQKEYDESKLLKDRNYQKNANRLAVAKNYLFQLILKCLRNNPNNSTPEMEIFELLLDIQSLYSRRLCGHAGRLVDKARKLAEENGFYDLLITIGDWERRLVEHSNDAVKYSDLYEKILEREANAAKQLQINTFYFNQFKKLRFFNIKEGYIKRGKVLDEFLSYLRHPELEDYSNASNPLAKLYFHFCYIEYYYAMREHKNRYLLNQRVMKLFDDYPSLAKNNMAAYIKSLVAYLLNQLHLGLFDEFDKNIVLLIKLKFPKKAHSIQRLRTFEYLFLQAYRYFALGKFEAAIQEVIPSIEEYYNEHSHQLIYRDELYLKLEVAWIYLGVRDYEKALEWIIPLQMQINPKIFTDNYTLFCLLIMMIHYEIGDAKVVADTAEITYTYLKSRDKMSSPEAFMIQFFQLASEDIHNKKKQRKLLLRLKEQTYTLRKYLYTIPVFPIDSIIWWIDSLLQNKTLAIIIQDNLKLLQNGKQSMEKEGQTDFLNYSDIVFPGFKVK